MSRCRAAKKRSATTKSCAPPVKFAAILAGVSPDLSWSRYGHPPMVHSIGSAWSKKSQKRTRKIKSAETYRRSVRAENITLQPPIQRAEQPTVQRAMQLPLRSTEETDAQYRDANTCEISGNENGAPPIPYRRKYNQHID